MESEYAAVSPQAAITYHITPNIAAYVSFAGGYKAGGFNSAGGAGRTTFDEERSWNYEIGFKGRALEDRLHFNVAFFYTDWQDLQLNTPNGLSPVSFDIVNAGDAVSKGIELGLDYEIVKGWDVFGSVGWQDVTFRAGSVDTDPFSGVPGVGAPVLISGRQVPYASDYTATVGTQFVYPLQGALELYGRADVQFIGGFNYDSTNNARGSQDAYSIANFRLGVRNPSSWFVEAFVNNAFDTEYMPLAFANVFSASGFVGESGAPVTFGVRAGVKF